MPTGNLDMSISLGLHTFSHKDYLICQDKCPGLLGFLTPDLFLTWKKSDWNAMFKQYRETDKGRSGTGELKAAL